MDHNGVCKLQEQLRAQADAYKNLARAYNHRENALAMYYICRADELMLAIAELERLKDFALALRSHDPKLADHIFTRTYT